MNSSNGIIEENNLFTLAASVEGQAPCPTTFTQHTGNLRNIIRNNIFAGTFPMGATEPKGYHPHADVGPYNALPWRSYAYTCSQSSPCYAFHAGNVYVATASGTSGTSLTSAPSCSAGVCPADGTMSWTFVQPLPTNPAVGSSADLVQSNNVTAWTVTSGTTADYPQSGWTFAAFPEFVSIDYSIYYQAGQTIVDYSDSNGSYTIAGWNALGQDMNTTKLGGWNADPNFVDMTGAQGLAGWAFKTSGGGGAACSGAGAGTYSPACNLGFVPFDFSGVGAH